MTPAVDAAKKANIQYKLHPYDHDPSATAWGEEAAEKLNIDPDRIFKTLVVQLDDGRLAVAVVPVAGQLDLKVTAKALKAKKAKMADKTAVARSTGYVLGGVSPLGQKKKLPGIIDESALLFDTIFVSAGRRGLQIELAPEDLAALTGAIFEKIGK